jgi:hypothetical protein
MAVISTRNLAAMPTIDRLLVLLQSLATLDAIMSPDEWDARYYSFNSQWSHGEKMGSMQNGSGDEFFALFNGAGCFIKGFAHEYPMTPYRSKPPMLWPGMLDNVPAEFLSALNEPAFSMTDVTFCIWRRYIDSSWSHSPVVFPDDDDPDGSAYLLAMLDGKPESYCQFAEDYWESTLPLESVTQIFDHCPLTDDLVESLNAEVNLRDLRSDLREIGYPAQQAK